MSRFLVRLFPSRRAICALALALLAMTPSQSRAQDAFADFWGSVFGVHRARPREAPRAAVERRPRAARAAPSRSTSYGEREAPRAWRPAAAAAPQVQPILPIAKPDAKFFVAVIGDSEAALLAQGLNEAFAADPRIAILNKAREDSGLVRDDFFDWRKAAKELLEGPVHVDMAVIQIGTNDNQRLRQAEGALDPLSKPFNEVYAKRVEEIAAAFRDKNVPLVWVGLPIMRSESLANAALVFNDIDRQYAGALGARFVDLWEPFSDVNSTYKASGPDVNGAIVRLRAADGVHFNRVGARKAAHFVEPEIRRVLDAALQPPPAPGETPAAAPSPSPGPAEAAPQAEPAKPDAVKPDANKPDASKPEIARPETVTPEAVAPPPKPLAGKVAPLTEPATSPGGALADLPAAPPTPEAAPAQPGRADDFHWPK